VWRRAGLPDGALTAQQVVLRGRADPLGVRAAEHARLFPRIAAA
jgi:hypothetical protein